MPLAPFVMSKSREKAIPKTRLSRFGRMARLAGGVTAGMLSEGVKQISRGNRPRMSDLALTRANVQRLTEQLSAMRGAAMKMGQLLSMETSDFLPRELADILAQLRSQAYVMPADQLEQAMQQALGENWQQRFAQFDQRPMAAASIGQVHRATTHAGENVVVKVQYPGVAESIDSDVDNMATLLKLTMLLPSSVDISRLLSDAKKQLHEEADYRREADYLQVFGEKLASDQRFVVPVLVPDLSTATVLTMSYVEGKPIDDLADLSDADVNQLMSDLFALLLHELFDLQLVQSDPNFANYLYQVDTGRIALLDFGATRQFSKKFATNYKRLLRGVIAADKDVMIDAASRIGYLSDLHSDAYKAFLVQVFSIALEAFAYEGEYDFKAARLSERLAGMSSDMGDFKRYWEAPPTDVLYLHRKLGGMLMLAMRLEAKVDLNAMVKPYLKRL